MPHSIPSSPPNPSNVPDSLREAPATSFIKREIDEDVKMEEVDQVKLPSSPVKSEGITKVKLEADLFGDDEDEDGDFLESSSAPEPKLEETTNAPGYATHY